MKINPEVGVEVIEAEDEAKEDAVSRVPLQLLGCDKTRQYVHAGALVSRKHSKEAAAGLWMSGAND